MGKAKIIFGNEVLMDLTGDTIKPEHVIKGYTGHDANGDPITGTNDWDSNTQDANAADSEILLSKKAVVKGRMIEGTMPNNGAVKGVISTKEGKYFVPKGFHDGSGAVEIAEAEQAKLIPSNIREGVTVLGVTGTMDGSEDVKSQAKEATPTTSEQVILPDTGYTHLSQVTVKPIPYSETVNSTGGIIVTIG